MHHFVLLFFLRKNFFLKGLIFKNLADRLSDFFSERWDSIKKKLAPTKKIYQGFDFQKLAGPSSPFFFLSVESPQKKFSEGFDFQKLG